VNPGPSGPILTVPILEVRDVRHAFGARQALRGVSLEVCPHEIYALLGPNGAGKTTLVRAICGRLKPDGGAVRIAGRDPYSDGEARALLGLAPQALALYPQLTVAENLQTFAALAGLKGRAIAPAVAHAMDVTHTTERASPKLLVLDEPTVGVDLAARDAITEALRRLRSDGVGILLVTHDLDQAQCLADRVGFLRDGEKVLEGAPDALIAESFGARMEVEVDVVEASDAEAAGLAAEGLERGASPGTWTCLSSEGYALAGPLAERLTARGVEVREVRVRRPSLQQLFARVAETRRAA